MAIKDNISFDATGIYLHHNTHCLTQINFVLYLNFRGWWWGGGGMGGGGMGGGGGRIPLQQHYCYNSFPSISCITHQPKERRKEGRKGMFYLLFDSKQFIYGYMGSDRW